MGRDFNSSLLLIPHMGLEVYLVISLTGSSVEIEERKRFILVFFNTANIAVIKCVVNVDLQMN